MKKLHQDRWGWEETTMDYNGMMPCSVLKLILAFANLKDLAAILEHHLGLIASKICRQIPPWIETGRKK